MMAKEAVHLKASEAPVITHGAGVWLQGEKAKKFAQNNPGKGIPCSWSDDQVRVVMEERGCYLVYPSLQGSSQSIFKKMDIVSTCFNP